MALFQPFRKATRPETPGFAEAEMAEGRFKQRAKAQENALRSQNMLGAAEIYNAGMGDRSPIADKLFGDTPETASTLDTLSPGAGEPGLQPSGAYTSPVAEEAVMADSALGAAEGMAPYGGAVNASAPTAMTAGGTSGMGAAGSGATVGAGAGAGAGAAGAGAGAGSGALASMGPYGWAALAAMALMNYG